MDSWRSVLTHAQPPEIVEPRQRPLHHPAILPQATAVRRPASGDVRPDTTPTPLLPMRVRVIASVAVQAVRPTARAAWLAAHRRDRIDQPDHRIDLRDVSCRRG